MGELVSLPSSIHIGDPRLPQWGQQVGALLNQATSASTPSTVAARDAFGRIKVTDPAAANDAATKLYVDNLVTTITGLNPNTLTQGWIANKPYTAGDIVRDPYGFQVARVTSGTARSAYDVTEAALWSEVTTVVSATRFGVKADGTTDDTAAMTAAASVAIGKVLVLPAGTILTGPLDFNGATRPTDGQWNGVGALYGRGRLATTIKAKTGAYTSGQAVVSLKNVSGVSVGGFSIEAQSVADVGCDFSWVGGSSGNPALAPSNRNNFSDIFVRGANTIGINFDQQHDSSIHAIVANAAASTGISISLLGNGGGLAMSDVICSLGKFRVGSQQAAFFNCNFFDGISLEGAGYNHTVFIGGQIYPNASTLVSIDGNGASGNADAGSLFSGVWFSTGAGGHTLIQGVYQSGLKFIACRFQTGYTAFFGTITPANGTGALPRMSFDHCSFASTSPVSVTSQLQVDMTACKNSAGSIVSSGVLEAGDNTSGTGINIGGGGIIRFFKSSPLTPWTTSQVITNGTVLSTGSGTDPSMSSVTNGNGFMCDAAITLPVGVYVIARGAGSGKVRIEVYNFSGASYTLPANTTFRVYCFQV